MYYKQYSHFLLDSETTWHRDQRTIPNLNRKTEELLCRTQVRQSIKNENNQNILFLYSSKTINLKQKSLSYRESIICSKFDCSKPVFNPFST